MLTVIHITANREPEAFASKIQSKLLEVIGDNPLISVSQKPIDLGHNICVGEVGSSYQNALLQMQIGAQAAQTEYVAIAEADQLYPPGYFDFKPDGQDVYLYKNLWLLRYWDKHFFYRKEYGDWLTIVKKDYLLERLALKLQYRTWGSDLKLGSIFIKRQWTYFDGLPVISMKTTNQTTRKSGWMDKGSGWTEETRPRRELPHWGRAADVFNDFSLGG